MASEFTLSVVAPDRLVLEEPIHSVVMPGTNGYFGALRGHEPTISSLKPGYIEYEDAHNQRHYIAVSGGFAEITGNKVSVLADSAERATEIDLAKAEAELERAREALRGGDSAMTRQEAIAELERATNRINVARMR